MHSSDNPVEESPVIVPILEKRKPRSEKGLSNLLPDSLKHQNLLLKSSLNIKGSLHGTVRLLDIGSFVSD